MGSSGWGSLLLSLGLDLSCLHLLLLHSDHLLLLWRDVVVFDEQVVSFGCLLVEVVRVFDKVFNLDGLGLQEHTSDLTGQVSENLVDRWVNSISYEVLLVLRSHLGKIFNVYLRGGEQVDWVVDLLSGGWLDWLNLLRHLMNLWLGLLQIHLLHLLLHLSYIHLGCCLWELLHLSYLVLSKLLITLIDMLIKELTSLWISSNAAFTCLTIFVGISFLMHHLVSWLLMLLIDTWHHV